MFCPFCGQEMQSGYQAITPERTACIFSCSDCAITATLEEEYLDNKTKTSFQIEITTAN